MEICYEHAESTLWKRTGEASWSAKTDTASFKKTATSIPGSRLIREYWIHLYEQLTQNWTAKEFI